MPVISIVGYTNAGKSTLLNALTGGDVLAEDKLFATLDPTSRRLRFPREREVIITDTVGFIRDLPKDLVAAFRATLEELADADLLLHVVDAADPRRDEQVARGREDPRRPRALREAAPAGASTRSTGSRRARGRRWPHQAGGVAISASDPRRAPASCSTAATGSSGRDGRVTFADVSRSADESEPEPPRILPSAPRRLREGTWPGARGAAWRPR